MKFKNLYFLFFQLLMIKVCSAQIVFQKYFGDFSAGYELYGEAAITTSDNGYILMSNFSFPFSTNRHLNVIKTDSIGSVVWSKHYSSNNLLGGIMMKKTLDTGLIITGNTNGNSGTEEFFLVKTNSLGDTIWTKFYNTIGSIVNDVCLTSDSGFVLTGTYSETGISGMYLLKVDKNGNTIFSYVFSSVDGSDVGFSVKETDDEGLIVAGRTLGNNYNVLLLRLDSNAQVIWAKSYGGTSFDQARCLQITFDGGFILAGNTDSTSMLNGDVLLLKTDSIGNLLWTKTYGGAGNDFATSVQQTSDSGFVITGSTYSFPVNPEKVYLIKTDSNGNLSWSKTLGWGGGKTVEQTIDGGYIIGGSNDLNITSCLIKTDSVGNTNCYNVDAPTLVTFPQLTDSVLSVTRIVAGNESARTLNVSAGWPTDTECMFDGISSMKEFSSLLISPNPARSGSVIAFSQVFNKAQVTIIDIVGKTVLKRIMTGDKLDIGAGRLIGGLYFVNIKTSESFYIVRLLID